MRDYETIIKSLDLPGHFKKYPPFKTKEGMRSRRLRSLIMNAVTWRELDVLQNKAGVGGDYCGIFTDGTEEEKAYSNEVSEIWQEMAALEDRTLDEGRMKPEKLYALQDDDTKTVFQVWKVLHDLEQGGRNESSGLQNKIRKQQKSLDEKQEQIDATIRKFNELDFLFQETRAERDELKAKCAKLEEALRQAQIELADTLQKQ